MLSGSIALVGSFAKQDSCLVVVFGYAATVAVHDAEEVLRVSVVLGGGLAIPGCGNLQYDAAAICEHEGKVGLPLRIALLGSFAIPVHRLGVVNGFALAVVGQIALLRGLAKPGQRLHKVPVAEITPGKRELGGEIAGLGPLLEGGVIRLLGGEGERAETEKESQHEMVAVGAHRSPPKLIAHARVRIQGKAPAISRCCGGRRRCR